MSSVLLTNVSPARLLMLGDAAFAAYDPDLALYLYNAALKAGDPTFEVRLRLRAGLARKPNPRTLTALAGLQALERVMPVFVGEGLATWGKTLPFMEDEKFLALMDKHIAHAPLPNWHWNLYTVVWAAQSVRGLVGDYVELGVFKGHTTLFAAEYLGFADWSRRWFLYDTFDGVPDDQLDPGWAEKNEMVYRGTFSFEEVRDRFAVFPNIEVIKGRVPEVFEARCPEQIAFLHVDLNNVTAEIAALELLYDRIPPGGIILFDDYGWAVSRRQFDAENAWFARRGGQVLALPTGQGLFVKSAA
jgi:O-methyltransferase